MRRTAWLLVALALAGLPTGCDRGEQGPTRIRISLILGDTS